MNLTTRSVVAGLIPLATICSLFPLPCYGGVLEETGSDGKAAKQIEQPKPPEPRFKLYGWIEAGFTGNTNAPDDRTNFGHVLPDGAREPMLNQAVITAERALDSSATGFDWGFKFQFMYGSDARYIHSLGLLDQTTKDIIQPDIAEAYG